MLAVNGIEPRLGQSAWVKPRITDILTETNKQNQKARNKNTGVRMDQCRRYYITYIIYTIISYMAYTIQYITNTYIEHIYHMYIVHIHT